jgi:hypothetical protein
MVGAAMIRRVLASFIGPTSVLLSICMYVLAPGRRKREEQCRQVHKHAVLPEALDVIRHLSPRVSVNLYDAEYLLARIIRSRSYSQL